MWTSWRVIGWMLLGLALTSHAIAYRKEAPNWTFSKARLLHEFKTVDQPADQVPASSSYYNTDSDLAPTAYQTDSGPNNIFRVSQPRFVPLVNPPPVTRSHYSGPSIPSSSYLRAPAVSNPYLQQGPRENHYNGPKPQKIHTVYPFSTSFDHRPTIKGQPISSPADTYGQPNPAPPADSYGSPIKAPESNYGPPDNSYGLPNKAPESNYGPPSKAPESNYGPPSKAPESNYGPPSKAPESNYGPPSKAPESNYGPPNKAPESNYGPPNKAPESNYGPPDSSYGLPNASPVDSYAHSHSESPAPPTESYGAPSYAPAPESFGGGYDYSPAPSYGPAAPTNEHREVRFLIHKAGDEEIVKDAVIQDAHATGDKISFIQGPNLEVKHHQKIYLPPAKKSIIYVLLKEPEIKTTIEVQEPAEADQPKPEVFIVYQNGDGVIKKHYDLSPAESSKVAAVLANKIRETRQAAAYEKLEKVTGSLEEFLTSTPKSVSTGSGYGGEEVEATTTVDQVLCNSNNLS